MKHALTIIENALNVAVNNEPINRAEGKVDQADLELVVAEECRKALVILAEHDEPRRG